MLKLFKMLQQTFGTAIEIQPVLPTLPEFDPDAPSYLSNAPKIVLKEILSFLDFKSILLLRKTCHNLHNSIDHLKPDLHFTGIQFHLTPTNVFIRLDYQEETYGTFQLISYIKTENGCEIECGPKKTHLENEDFVDIALRDYELLLTYQNEIMDLLLLSLEYFEEDPWADTEVLEPIAQRVLERTETILTRRDRQLKTKRFEMTVIRQDQVMKILKLIDPNSLKQVWIRKEGNRPTMGMDCEEMDKLEQWEKAEKLRIWGFNSVSPIGKLMDFVDVSVFSDVGSIEDVLEVKKNFLQSSKLRKFSIKYNEFDDADELIPFLGQSQFETKEYGDKNRNWFYKHSNSNNVLRITHASYYTPKPHWIHFVLMKIEDLTTQELEILQ